MPYVNKCPKCDSTEILLEGTKIRNKQYEVIDGFYFGTRVIEIRKRKLLQADIVRIYQCEDCGMEFEEVITRKSK